MARYSGLFRLKVRLSGPPLSSSAANQVFPPSCGGPGGPIPHWLAGEFMGGGVWEKNVWTLCGGDSLLIDVSPYAGPIFWKVGNSPKFWRLCPRSEGLRLYNEFLASLVPAAAREVFRSGARGEGPQGFSIG